jgi:hypothetical protein
VAPASYAEPVGEAMRKAWDAAGVRTESFKLTRPAGRYEIV